MPPELPAWKKRSGFPLYGMQMAKSYKGTLVCAIVVAVCTTVIGLFLSYYAGLKPGGMIVLLEVAWFVIVMAVKSFNK